MIYLKIALLCLIMISGSIAENDTPVDEIPAEEIRKLFHTSFVPKYEFVDVKLSERSQKRQVGAGRSLHIKAFGRDINLWLELGNSSLIGEDTPVYYAKHERGHIENVVFQRRDGLMERVGRIFEDPARRASLVIGQDEAGRPTVNGYIGASGMVIRSVPHHVAENFRRRQRSADGSDNVDQHRHIVFKTAENKETDLPINQEVLQQRIARSSTRLRVPDTLYMEVLLVVENSVFRTYSDLEIYDCLQYLMAYANGIDLKYRSFESPKIRLHISGIVLAKDPLATPYIANNSLGVDVFDTNKALPASSSFFFNVQETFPPDSYDIALTMTRQLFGVGPNQYILGQAYLGTACKRDDDSFSIESVTITQDDGAFGGVHVAAHEIGHLIGCPHDAEMTIDDCVYTNGFIMSFTPYFTKNSSDFSTCSVDAISNALQESKLDCLFNPPPSVGKILPKILPGKIKDLTEQCKTLKRKAPCQNPYGPTDICVNIFCTDEHDRCYGTRTAAVDGTTCGENKICLHNECVDL